MSKEEAIILKERAREFLENAEYLFRNEKYDLAAFNLEQSCQLLLKYVLLVRAGAYPKTHSILRLLREVEKALPDRDVSGIIRSEITKIPKLDDAYIVSRYFPRRYVREEITELMTLVKKIWDVIGDV